MFPGRKISMIFDMQESGLANMVYFGSMMINVL